jgi:imidazolonepropionase-like amidohydrolase
MDPAKMVRTFVLFLTVAGCQALPPDDSCETCTALTGGAIFDGEASRAGTVILQGRQIVKIVWGEAHVRSGTIVRIAGQTILPGLYDLHVHLPAAPGPYGYFPEENLVAEQLKPLLRSGVTTFLDLGSSQSMIFALRDRIALREALPRAPTMLAAGPLLTATGGHPCYAGDPPGDACRLLDSPSDVTTAMAELLRAKPDVIKVVLESGSQGRPLPRMSKETLAEVVKQSGGVPVFAHVSHRNDVIDALDVGVRVFAHIPMEDRFTDGDCARLAAEHATLIPTVAVADALHRIAAGTLDELNDPTLAEDVALDVVRALANPQLVARMRTPEYQAFAKNLFDNAMANLKSCVAAGVQIAAGTDAGNPGTFHGRAVARELELYVEAGLTPAAALRAATEDAASILKPQIPLDTGALGGRVELGALADLLIVDGDPAKDITAVRHVARVYKSGLEIDRGELARGGTRWSTQKDAAAGSVCFTPDECASGLSCSIDGLCAKSCGFPEECPVGDTCFPALAGSTGACHAGDGCDLHAQDCPNGAACIWWGNGATGCWFAGSGTAGAGCGDATGCAPGFQCDYFKGKCVELCDPAAPTCTNGQMCIDRSAEAGLTIGECA